MSGKNSHTGLMDIAPEIIVSFLLVGIGIVIIVSIGPHWFEKSAESVSSSKIGQIHDDLQEACLGRPQLDQQVTFSDSRGSEYITACGPERQKLCLKDLEAGGSIEKCDSIEIKVEDGDRCAADSDFWYDATKSGSKAVLTCK